MTPVVSPLSSAAITLSPSTRIRSGAISLDPPTKIAASVRAFFLSGSAQYDAEFRSIHDPVYTDHFTKSKEAVLEAAEGLKGTALLLGVGGAYDLPLGQLAEQFDQIELVDFDLSLTNNTLAALPDHLRSKFHLHQADLAGVWKQFSDSFDSLDPGISYDEFCEAIPKIIAELKPVRLPYVAHSASFVASSLLSSQLCAAITEYINSRAESRYGKPSSFSAEELNVVSQFYTGLKTSHLADITSWLAPGGRIYFADHFSSTEEKRYRPISVSIPIPDQTSSTVDATAQNVKDYVDSHFLVKQQRNWSWVVPRESKAHVHFKVSGDATVSVPTDVYSTTTFDIVSLTLEPK